MPIDSVKTASARRLARLTLQITASASEPSVLTGCVALITGASRGIGKGCALELAKAGCTVYITGRSLLETPTEISKAASMAGNGGSCIGLACDHTDIISTERVFERIDKEQGGRLDILVNSTYDVVSNAPKRGTFWWDRESVEHWDSATNVGLRAHYMCSLLAARRMSKLATGLIISISGPGGMHPEAKNLSGEAYRPSHRSTAYVVAKTATDRMMADMAGDLKKVGVAAVSVWPGGVLTERVKDGIYAGQAEKLRATGRFESPEFVGRAVTALATDRQVLQKTGKVLMPHELAIEYGFADVDGRVPRDDLNMLPLRKEMMAPPSYWKPDWPGFKKP